MVSRSAWLAGLALASIASVALAHGGAYQPPPPPPGASGSVPPGSRNPTPTPSGPTGGPVTGGGSTGPITGGPTKGPTVPGGPVTGGGTTTPRPAPRGSGGVGLAHWTRWWYPNRMHVLRWTARVGARRNVATTPGARTTEKDQMWRAEVQRALVDALGSSNDDIASGAAIALGKAGDIAETEALVRTLEDSKSAARSVREAAALGLGLLPVESGAESDQARSALAAVVTSGREPTRLRAMAVYALGLRGELASLPLLVDTAASAGASWDVPAAAVSALGLAGYDITREDLERLLDGPKRGKKRETMRRAYAAHALALIGDPVSLASLREAVQDRDEDVRRAAAMALGAIAKADDDETAEVLVRMLHRDRDGPARHMAALALGRIGHDRAEGALRYAYRKGDRMLQPFAALGLGLFARHPGRRDASIPLVKELKTRANADLRGALAIAVGLSGNSDGAPMLRHIVLDRGDPQLRGHAALALGLLDDRDGGAPALRKLLEETHDPSVTREAALALGMLGDREALRILVRLVEQGNSVYEQGSAAVALGRIGGADAGAALLELLRKENRPDLARAMAAVGLGLLLDRTEGERLAAIGGDLNWYLFTPTVHEILTIL